MSGAISLGTIAALVGGVGALGGAAYGIYNGQQQNSIQKQALARQNTAQKEAVAGQLSTERQAAVAEKAANEQAPNVSAILARAAQMGNAGLSSTMLTSPTGISSPLALGKNTLLGS